ncbi:hypothetical protein Vadar_014198 [Vaccinium darrowii]|nr:hypothetical protein Vadar_014198 [Vaccinium darrowii]
MMKSIPQLRELKIWGCKVLSRIVAEENGQGESSVDEVEFPQLASLKLQNLPNLVSFSPKVTTTVQPLFSGKVAIPSLKYLELQQLKNLSDLWFSELPTGSFSELKELEVIECKNLRTTFPPFMVEALANLEKLVIRNCSKMEAVVNSEEKGQGRKIDKAMFPQLKKLELHSLPNLRMFCSFTRPSDLPLLRQKDIRDCPSMDAFSLGHLSFPKLCLPGTSSKDILNHPRWFAEEQDHLDTILRLVNLIATDSHGDNIRGTSAKRKPCPIWLDKRTVHFFQRFPSILGKQLLVCNSARRITSLPSCVGAGIASNWGAPAHLSCCRLKVDR